MENVSPIGIVLYMILSIVGGGLTGLFAGYMYFVIRKEFGILVTILINIVFYIVPIWAAIRLFDTEAPVIFYLCLLFSYFYGVWYSRRLCISDPRPDPRYSPPDDD